MSMILPPTLGSQLFLWEDGKYRFIEEPIIPNPSGSTLVINGSGFGTGPTYVLFDRTEGVDGEDVPLNSPEIGTYASTNPNMAEPSNLPRYKTHLGRTWLTERRAPAVEDGLAHQAGFKFEFNSTDEFRVSYRLSVPQGKRWCGSGIDQPPNPNLSHHKPIWLGTDSAVNDGINSADNAADIVICTFSGSGGQRLTGGNSINCANRWYNGFHTDSMTVGTQTWQTWYQKYDSGTPANSVNHEMIVCDTAFQQAEETGDVFAGVAGLIQYYYDVALIPGYYGNAASGSEAPFDYTNVDHLMTDISISVGPNAGKMLLLGDNPVLANCTRVYEVPADSWSDSQIEASPKDWEKLDYYFIVNKSTVIQSGVASYTSVWSQGQPPVPTALSGTWSEGATMTLTGSNFSTEATETFFTDFSGDTLGQFPSGFFDWNDSVAKYSVVQDGSPPIGQRSIRLSAINQAMGTATYQYSAEQDEIFLECWLRLNKQSFISESQPGVEQIKLSRIVDGTGTSSMQERPTRIDCTYLKSSGLAAGYSQDETGNPSYYAKNAVGQDWAPSDTEWAKFLLYYKLGTEGQPDGAVLIKYGSAEHFRYSGQPANAHMASPSATIAKDSYQSEGIVTHNATNSGLKPRRVALPYFHRDDQETIVDIARFLTSNSRERVMVGDAATWSACDKTKTYSLETIERNSTQIEFKASNSSLIPGSKWLYTVNHDGLINENGVAV